MAWGRLALIQNADDAQTLDKLADVFGYARKPERYEEEQVQNFYDPGKGLEIDQITEQTETTPKRPPARFLRINKIIETETDRKDFQKPSYLSDPSMRLPASTGTYRFAAPEPLMPIARLLPLLFNSLAQARTGHNLDHRQLLKRIVHGKALQRLPKQQRQRWPQRLQIIVDASPRLEPHWSDFESIVKQLQTLLGQEAVQALRFDENTLGEAISYCLPWPTTDHDPWRIWQSPPADVAVLILSDLGVADSRASVAWRRQLAALQQHHSPVLTLSPGVASATDKLFCQQLKPNAFNDGYPVPRHPLLTGFSLGQPNAQSIEDILTWLALLPLIDTGLLRRLRIAMHWGDSSLETLLWNHPAMRDIGLGVCLQAHLADAYQQRFQQHFAASEKATEFWGIVERHHAQAYQGLRQLEMLKQSYFQHKDEPDKDMAKNDLQTSYRENFSVRPEPVEGCTEKFHPAAASRSCFDELSTNVLPGDIAISGSYFLPDPTRDYFHRLCATGMQSASHPAQQQALRMQCRTVLASLPSSIWHSKLQDLAYHLYAVANEEDIRAGRWPEQLPSGFNPERLQWLAPTSSSQEQQWWHIVQVGDQGQIKCERCDVDKTTAVTTFKTELSSLFPPRLTVYEGGNKQTYMQKQDFSVTLSEHKTAVFEERGLEVELEAIRRPSWASRIWRDAKGLWCSITWQGKELDVFWQVSLMEPIGAWQWPSPFGEDEYGLYVDLRVKAVSQRFRWLEPGTFWMGSPKDEPEREWNGSEGGEGTETLHEVTLSQGFWLADTAVSQAFWMVVMSDNPSRFNSNVENPVELVSWDDAQVFIGKLNNLFPGLLAQLPSEAQWEYACRAGTSTPFSFGTNITPEQVNYDGNYPYAGAQEGLNRRQTVPVKSLPANPWGFYEMHGNVWEWCADAWQPQLSSQPVTDPLHHATDPDAARVVRGGSWYGFGGDARSAIHGRYTPDFRNDVLGFRLALGHVEPSSGQEAAAGGGPGRRVAEQRQTGPLPAAEVKPTANWLERLKKPFSKSGRKKK